MSRSRHNSVLRHVAGRAGFACAVGAIVLWSLFPLYWAVVTSFTPGTALFSVRLWPEQSTWSNYAAVFAEQEFGRNLLNSLLAAGGTVALSLAVATLAAQALGRVRFRGRNAFLYGVLGVSMFPQIAVLAGLFELVRALGLYNHPLALVLSYTLFTLPFTVWVLTVFTADLPLELEEAARVDGASAIVMLVRVFLPLLAPALVAAGLLAFIAAWNEFLFALTFTLNNNARTVPVAIALISGASQYELPWGRVMAASVVVTVPLGLGVWACQRWIVSGLTAGAVKG